MNLKEDPILMEVREVIYNFLSTSFLHSPTPSHIKTIIQQKLFEDFPLTLDTQDFVYALELLTSWAKENEHTDPETLCRELLQDYNALFVGPGHLLAPPWESVYLTEEKLTFGPPTMEVRAFYLRHGLEYFRKNHEPDDHFGLEMEFMAKLVSKQRQAQSKQEEEYYIKEQMAFLEDHVLKWLNDFTNDVYQYSKTKYFQGLALLAREFLNWDYQNLKESEPKSPLE